MTEQTARELLMDYLYNEIPAADKKKLEAYLAEHPELQHEIEELRQTQAILQRMPETKPAEKLLVMDPDEDNRPDWWRNVQWLVPPSGWARMAFATAACLMLLLITGALVNLNIQSSEAGFSVSFGAPVPTQSQAFSDAQTDAIVQQIQQENAAILTEYADMLNKHNQQQLQQFAEYFERQRLNDLQTIDQALNQYQQETDYQFKQTHQVLGEVIQTVAKND